MPTGMYKPLEQRKEAPQKKPGRVEPGTKTENIPLGQKPINRIMQEESSRSGG